MNIHEHQAKALLSGYGVTTLAGKPAFTVEEAVAAAEELGGPVWVVKAQIHAGGRGKAGGVKVVKSVDEVRDVATELLGKTLVTPQTGAEGRVVRRLYIEDGCDIARELYLSLLVDRAASQVTVIASTEGGMDIEEVAAATPEKILTLPIDPATGFQAHHSRRIANQLGLSGDTAKKAGAFLNGLYAAFTCLDASLLEINPLVVTGDGDLVALDAKMGFDDNALYRQADVVAMRDEHEEDPAEIEASKYDLSYIKLDGTSAVWSMVLVLPWRRLISSSLKAESLPTSLMLGAAPQRKKVTQAFKIILSDPGVEGILVNIFGGIMRCDIIADGVVAAAREFGLEKPLVVRLAGTNVEEGKTIMKESGLQIIPADTLAEAAKKIVAAVKGA